MMPFSTVSKIGSCICSSAGSATQTSRPPRRSDANACSNGARRSTASAIATSAPPSAWIASTGSSCAAFDDVVGAELASRARACRRSTSTAMTVPPAIRAYCTREVAESADAEDRDELGGRTPATLTALYVVTPAHVSGAASSGATPSGTGTTKSRAAEHVLRVGAVDRVAGVVLLLAQRLAPVDAVPALAARVAEPRDRDPRRRSCRSVTPAPERLDDADALVPGHERQRRLDRPVAVRGVDVGVAQPGGLDADEDLPGPGVGIGRSCDRAGG